jgi:hypothetical protein
MAVIPLIDVHVHIFSVPPHTALYAFGQSVTWILLILSSIFYTIGSYVFARAFEDPSPKPLLANWKHFQTDELLSAWIFLFGSIPSIPYSIVFLSDNFRILTNWGVFFAALILNGTCAWFVYVCYPTHQHLRVATHYHILNPLY